MKPHSYCGCLLASLLISSCGSDSKTPEQRAQEQCRDSLSAFLMAESFVEDRLKAPATADFATYGADGTSVTYQGDCTHEVHSYVDAQNSFGANIRTQYVAVVQNKLGTDSWHLKDLRIDD